MSGLGGAGGWDRVRPGAQNQKSTRTVNVERKAALLLRICRTSLWDYVSSLLSVQGAFSRAWQQQQYGRHTVVSNQRNRMFPQKRGTGRD